MAAVVPATARVTAERKTGVSCVASIVCPTIITLWVAIMGVLLMRRATRLEHGGASDVGSTLRESAVSRPART